ncbi:MAG: thioredoxin domain-containing protein, partial [Gammaproteobacteria bacterium]
MTLPMQPFLFSLLMSLSIAAPALTPLPGAPPLPPALAQRIQAAIASRGEDYLPRTRHLLEDGRPRWTNRLILEDSPYLLQHAHNPVDWYPWGEEAFAAARELDRPVFLSIGYSTCHWCHVMEHESFEDPEIARYLNEHFVCVKVDREQRPDVDSIYMTAVMLLRGQGGWPLSAFLTPEGEPFFAGTYYPPAQFRQLLQSVVAAWRDRREQLGEQAREVTEAIRQVQREGSTAAELERGSLPGAIGRLLERLDRRHGGFGQAPKFPSETSLLLLLDDLEREPRKETLEAVGITLDHMLHGGIHDQVGGGFHRYATDPLWLVPHFEKMLYNQAQLALAYQQAHRLTGRERYARVVRDTLDWVLRDLRDPGGAFHAAVDADDPRGEGVYYTWTREEIGAALPPELARLAIDLYGVTPGGNFDGRSILHLETPLAEYAEGHGLSEAELLERVAAIRAGLLQARAPRPAPAIDRKVVTAWNGMTIEALARAATDLGEPRYLEAASAAADWLWQVHRREGGGLWRASLDGRPSVPGVLGDYAHLALGLLALYDAGEPARLEQARRIVDEMVERFHDPDQGGFYMNEADSGLLQRPRPGADDALPSGNGAAALALARLARRGGSLDHERLARETVAAFATGINRSPDAFPTLLLALRILEEGETGPLQYGARGGLRAEGRMEGGRLRLRLGLQPPWHVNSHTPTLKELVPFTLQVADGWRLGEVAWPEAVERRLAFEPGPLSLY